MEDAFGDITAILNLYRRPGYLKEQVEAIRNQTVPPKEIWVWVNHHSENEEIDLSELGVDRVFRNDYNWKYHGRFAAAMLVRTEYIALFDDDTIPGKKWFENCLTCGSEGILGSAGVVLNSPYYVDHERVGWNGEPPNETIREVDLVGHSWFFHRDTAKYIWSEPPIMWDNGEDIQFSFFAKKHGGIKTYVPPHPKDDIEMHGSLKGWEYGTDIKASSNGGLMAIPLFYAQRDLCLKIAMENGWETVNDIDKLWNSTGVDKTKSGT